MNNSIYPCLWFDGQAKNAATFYCSIFNHSKIISENPIVTKFEIEGKTILALNGGSMFTINPSISLFVACSTFDEIEKIYDKLSDGGKIMMPLDTYPWSEKYAWITDKFGMTWQLMLDASADEKQKITTSFLFSSEQFGKAYQAIVHYVSIFPSSQIIHTEFYKEDETQAIGNLKFGHFSLNNEPFNAMDGPGNHAFQFNEGLSLVIECKTQEEIDHYWERLTEDGQESSCGWLKDKFGVSWQIVPAILGELMNDVEKAPRVTQAFLKMKKFDLEAILNA